MQANTPEQAIKGKYRENEAGCWIWTGAVGRFGHGRVRVGGKLMMAHRVAYEIHRGPIPAGLELDHVVCNTPACINPAHVAPTTHRANVMRGNGACALNARKSKCPSGHPYDKRDSSGRRRCSQCLRDRHREYQRARRAAAC